MPWWRRGEGVVRYNLFGGPLPAFRLPRSIRSTALARFGLDFDDGAAHARAVIAVHRKLAAEFLRGETREKVLEAVGAALLPGAEPESRKAVKGLFCATEMDGTYSASAPGSTCRTATVAPR